METRPSSVKIISFILALIPLSFFGLLALASGAMGSSFFAFFFGFWAFVGAWLAGSAVRMNNQWEESVILRLGKYDRMVGAGLYFVWPAVETVIVRDVRIRTMDIPRQEVITKDNISVGVDAVVFLRVADTAKSIINIQNFSYAVKQYAQTTLRNIIGQRDLDGLLEQREEIAAAVKQAVDAKASEWGIDITGIELQNIELPDNMKRVMARQAEAEREKRAVIIKSEGEVQAADNLKKAAEILTASPGGVAVKLREFETISDISYDQSNTIVFYPSGLGSDSVMAGAALSESVSYKKEKSDQAAK